MPALATVAQVEARLGEPIEEPDDIALAEACLVEESNLFRFYAPQPLWTASTAPAVAITIAVAEAARAWLNPAGYDSERGDMVTFNRGKDYTAGAALTAQEISIVKALGARGNARPVCLQPRQKPIPPSRTMAEDRGYAPVDWGSNKPFPLGYDY